MQFVWSRVDYATLDMPLRLSRRRPGQLCLYYATQQGYKYWIYLEKKLVQSPRLICRPRHGEPRDVQVQEPFVLARQLTAPADAIRRSSLSPKPILLKAPPHKSLGGHGALPQTWGQTGVFTGATNFKSAFPFRLN